MSERDLFIAALQSTSPAERSAWLDRECGGDVALRQRIDVLLQAYDKAGSLLENPVVAAGATADEPITEGPGAVIGPYKLLQQIGEGGMGTVFMAEQTQPVQRKVALKIIKPGMDSRQVIARFEAERQALALMDHPHIAKVLDAGTTTSSRPYFVMELVKGVPLTRYCDEHHLTPKQRLELFLPVCQAVQHAHHKGIIHRDLKPSNVMVAEYDDKPVAKVIDFGVAKATGPKLTERTMFTELGQVVGTLEYMSPEQAKLNALDIDTRSDIYALGVLLYELLTGSTPFEKKRLHEAAFDEMLRIIREEEPPTPSTRLSTTDELPSIAANRGLEPKKLSGLVRGELDWIVMKCLEKDRNRRYESANGLAHDIERYLHDEPVQACPPSASYRLRKFVRRNKRGLALAAVLSVAALVAVGAITASIGWVMRDREVQQAKLAGDFALALERAELLHEQGKRIEALAAYEHADLLYRQAAPGSISLERLRSVKALLDAEAQDDAFLDRFEGIRLQEQSLVDPEKNVFLAESVYPSIRAAFQQYGIEVGVTPHAEVLARIQGRPKAVQPQLLAALEECFRVAPRDDAAAREWLIAVLNAADDNPWRVQVRKAVRDGNTLALVRLAKEVDVSQQPPSFLIAVVRLLALREPVRLDLGRRVQRAYPGDFWANHRLGIDLRNSGKPLEAIHYLTAALAVQPRNPGSYLNRAITYEDTKDLAQALADINQAIDLAQRYAIAWRIKGRLLQKLNDPDKAEAALRQALVLNPSDTSARSLLIDQLMKAKRHQDAAVELRQTIELDLKDAAGHEGLGNALIGQQKWDEAVAVYRKAIDSDPNNAIYHYMLGNALIGQQKWDEAAAAFRTTIKLDPKSGIGHYGLGSALHVQKKWDEAIAAYRKAIEVDCNYAQAHLSLGYALLAKGQPGEAIVAFRRLVELAPGGRAAARFHMSRWAIEYAAQGRSADTFQLIDELLARGDLRGGGPGTVSHTIGSCVQHFRKLGDLAACRAAAAALEKKNPPDAWSLYNAACCRALTAAAQAQAGEPGAARLAKEEADRAMAWLTKAVAAGFVDVAGLCRDADLDVLRDREDFRKLLADLVAKAPPMGKARYDLLLSQWDKAAAAYAKAFDLEESRDPSHWFEHAALQWQTGNAEGYRKACRRMLELFGQSGNVHEIAYLAHTCVLAPDALLDAERVLQLAERRMALSMATALHTEWSPHVLGLAHYRAGHYEKALEALNKGLKGRASAQGEVRYWDVADWLVLALAHQRLNHSAEARQWLDRAQQWIKKKGRGQAEQKVHPGESGVEGLVTHLVQREAEALLKEGSGASDQKPKGKH
jgi:serine/threonine protein kinase/tetratricopeptide (TPR) repeat protein